MLSYELRCDDRVEYMYVQGRRGKERNKVKSRKKSGDCGDIQVARLAATRYCRDLWPPNGA